MSEIKEVLVEGGGPPGGTSKFSGVMLPPIGFSVLGSNLLENENLRTYAEWIALGLVAIALTRVAFVSVRWVYRNWHGNFTLSVQTEGGIAVAMSYKKRAK